MEKWNYKMPEIYKNFTDCSQSDWNQTLITKFNFISIPMEKPILLKVPNKLRPLIESLIFLNILSDNFIIEFVDIDSNEIDIMGEKLLIENY